jgi:hypothetical protein
MVPRERQYGLDCSPAYRNAPCDPLQRCPASGLLSAGRAGSIPPGRCVACSPAAEAAEPRNRGGTSGRPRGEGKVPGACLRIGSDFSELRQTIAGGEEHRYFGTMRPKVRILPRRAARGSAVERMVASQEAVTVSTVPRQQELAVRSVVKMSDTSAVNRVVAGSNPAGRSVRP